MTSSSGPEKITFGVIRTEEQELLNEKGERLLGLHGFGGSRGDGWHAGCAEGHVRGGWGNLHTEGSADRQGEDLGITRASLGGGGDNCFKRWVRGCLGPEGLADKSKVRNRTWTP